MLDAIVAARLRRGLTTVIDTLGLDADRRAAAVALGRAAGLPVVAVRFTTALDVCRARNRLRDRPVPAPVLRTQFTQAAALDLAADGFDLVLTVDTGSAEVGSASTGIDDVRTCGRGRAERRPPGRAPVRPADLVVPVGSGPAQLAARGGDGRGAGWVSPASR